MCLELNSSEFSKNYKTDSPYSEHSILCPAKTIGIAIHNTLEVGSNNQPHREVSPPSNFKLQLSGWDWMCPAKTIGIAIHNTLEVGSHNQPHTEKFHLHPISNYNFPDETECYIFQRSISLRKTDLCTYHLLFYTAYQYQTLLVIIVVVDGGLTGVLE